jgi:hypothetical protein
MGYHETVNRSALRKSVFLLSLLSLGFLFGEAAVLVEPLDDGLWQLNYRAPEDERILESIQQGLTSEILFQIRVYQDPRRFFGFHDGKLVLDDEIRVEGRWDRFNRSYIVTRGDLVERFDSSRAFLDRFLTLSYPPLDFRGEKGVHQILVRSRLTPMRLSPPFTLVQPVLILREKWREPWIEFNIEIEEES